MRTEAARRQRFLPYRYARAGIDARIESCVLDGRDRVEPDREGHLLALDVAWTTAHVSMSIEVPPAIRAEVVPAGAAAGAVELLAVVRCPATLTRVGVRKPVTEPITTIDFSLRRDRFLGVAELQVFLVRSTAAPPCPGYATGRGARLADARAWEIRFDRVRELRGEYLEVRYHPFSEEPTIPVADRENLYLLRMDQEAPELWVNADHERIVAVLDSKGTVGRHARVREVAFDQISQGVWTQLFVRAARDYVETGEMTYPWQEAVLDNLLRDMFLDARSVAERHDRLTDLWQDLPELLGRLDSVLQRRSGVSAHLAKLIEELEDGG